MFEFVTARSYVWLFERTASSVTCSTASTLHLSCENTLKRPDLDSLVSALRFIVTVRLNAMTKELLQEKKTQLALAIAQGKSVALWASENLVPQEHGIPVGRPARGQVHSRVSPPARRNRALGRMATRDYWESYRIAKLARVAESEPVKLEALRSILSDAVAVSDLSHLKRRVAAIKEELHEQPDSAGPSCPAVPCSLVGTRIESSENAPLCLTFALAPDTFPHGDHDPHLLTQY